MKLRLMLLLLFPLLLQGQSDTSGMGLWPGKTHFKSYVDDLGYTVSAPARFDGKDWLKAGLVTAGGLAIMSRDKDIHRSITSKQAPWLDDATAYFFEPTGKGIYPLLLTGGLYLHSTIHKHEYDRNVALTAIKSMVISQVITQTAKQIFHRHRPEQASAGHFDGPLAPPGFNSFPSGHATMAFSAATLFAMAYRDKKWVAPTAYSVAVLSSLSRVYESEHWPSDIFFGAITGYFVSRLLVLHNLEKETGFPVKAGLTNQGIGIWVDLK
jgi:membrane-associated phospholipid phosphatase